MTTVDSRQVSPTRTDTMTDLPPAAPDRIASGASRLWFAPESPVPIVAGIVLTLAGFGLIALTWSKVAGLAAVALQVPYIVSAGFTGICLVLVGLVLVSTSIRRQDIASRERQMAQLRAILLESKTDGAP